MSYTTLAALTVRAGEDLLIQITDRGTSPTGAVDAGVVDGAIASAAATIDASLAVRYRLPLASTPPVVAEVATSIALYRLHRFAPDAKIKDDYEQALKDLDAIAAGRKKLDLAGIEPAGSGAGGVVATDRERPLTADNLRGFI